MQIKSKNGTVICEGETLVDAIRSAPVDEDGRRVLRTQDFDGADFRGADLAGADLSNTDISCADFDSADLRGADMTSCKATAAVFSGADLRGADLRGADLRMVFFQDNARLSGADLRGADMAGACLFAVDVTLANTTGVDSTKWFRDCIRARTASDQTQATERGDA